MITMNYKKILYVQNIILYVSTYSISCFVDELDKKLIQLYSNQKIQLIKLTSDSI